MHFLSSKVKGRAAECIANLTVTAENYEIAWNTLTSRFEDKRQSLNAHLSALLNLAPITRESAADLEKLFDQITIAIASLERLKRTPENLWHDVLVHIIVQKLDPKSRKAWSLKDGSHNTFPSYDDLRRFIQSRTRALKEYATTLPGKPATKNVVAPRIHAATASTTAQTTCPLCQANHLLTACPTFMSKTPSQRHAIAKQQKRCINCFSNRHSLQKCKSKYTCRVCRKRHHSMLHFDSDASSSSSSTVSTTSASPPDSAAPSAVTSLFTSAVTRNRKQVALATAWVTVQTSSGRAAVVRALIDPGSEMTLISENLAQLLRAKRIRMPMSITAVGNIHAGTFRYATEVAVSSRQNLAPSFSTTALILGSLTSYIPKRNFNMASLGHLSYLPWADTNATSSDPIAIIIGADLYSDIIVDGVRKGDVGQAFAQNSIFGWIITGPIPLSETEPRSESPTRADDPLSANITAHHVLGALSLEEELRRFWEVEELPRQAILSPDERRCEEHFYSSHYRDAQGRYVVRLPFKKGPPIDIDTSKFRAEKSLNSLIRRSQNHSSLEAAYRDFLSEYESLGHMRPAIDSQGPQDQNVYIPHHGVFRETSTTTRLRVVFNASSLTSNGTSLNDFLHVGPKLQAEITSVILQWRRYRYVYSSDIAKMYRQIRVDDRDINYQRILWTPLPSSSPTDYQLLTVTYGMSCAPFLALRVIQQLVQDEGHHFPLATPVLRENIYVDDVLFGAVNATIARETRDQVISLLKRGGFELRKWASNSPTLLQDIDIANHGLAGKKPFDPDEQLKILGIGWSPTTDRFEFSVSLAPTIPFSKRTILAAIATLYDPLGWVTPVIITAKIFLQHLWRLKVGWDDRIPDTLLSNWTDIYSRLVHLKELKIPRWCKLESASELAELHGFADASNNAYAAAVYLKVIDSSGAVTITLLVGKSKVAPLKPLNIPRLELSAALLLARLVEFVRESKGYRDLPCFCWTDSTIVLAWVTQHPSRWKTFVANRVAEIQTRIPKCQWRHVLTENNPADCASRGLFGDEILNHTLWWRGPPWLRFDADKWPRHEPRLPPSAPLEERIASLQCSKQRDTWELATKYSSWPKLLRVTAYLIKFARTCRSARSRRDARFKSFSSDQWPALTGVALSVSDCNAARTFWLKKIQVELFPIEIAALAKNHPLSPNNSILPLRPFLDQDEILRVGGRLSKAPFPFSFCHPVLLSPHPLVTLIVKQTHLRALHAGPQLTLNLLRRDFWIIRARNLVKNVVHNCVACTRERAAIPSQVMGDLPETRVSPTLRSFLHCGVDYAGPVQVRTSADRGCHSRKAYIAVFLCLTTKVIHLELVSDYSTPAFLNAYSRFCSRRGLPQAMYSDNGTTFVGADREMTRAYRAAVRDSNFLNMTASDNVAWHFIPPSAPHFGGLWEAGVRSVKTHLRRVLGAHTVTFKAFTTLLCRVEACLNSRPIAPLSDTLEDYEYLTPGHFLIGSAPTVNPELSLLAINENRLSRWQLVRHMTERFWKLWSTDYVNTLQQRAKWRTVKPQITVGRLVLLRNSALPPCKWELGRVIQCHPGSDGCVRVVTVKTATSEYRRPIVKLCVLPVTSEATSR